MRVYGLCLFALLGMSSCGDGVLFPAPSGPLHLANIRIGHVGVVTSGMVQGAYSNAVSPEDLASHLRGAITSKLAGLDGARSYNIGVKVTSYMLANPAVPTVSSPKSALIMSVTVWDDSRGQKPVAPPATVIAVDGLYGTSVFITKQQGDKDHRLAALSAKAALEIERYLTKNIDIFTPKQDGHAPAVAVLAPDAAQPAANVN